MCLFQEGFYQHLRAGEHPAQQPLCRSDGLTPFPSRGKASLTREAVWPRGSLCQRNCRIVLEKVHCFAVPPAKAHESQPSVTAPRPRCRCSPRLCACSWLLSLFGPVPTRPAPGEGREGGRGLIQSFYLALCLFKTTTNGTV